jgi:hypothetical protein
MKIILINLFFNGITIGTKKNNQSLFDRLLKEKWIS